MVLMSHCKTWIYCHFNSYIFMDMIGEIKTFIENETRSCSMDFGGITPEYIYRMLGGKYSIEEIQNVLTLCLKDYYEH